jgi:hypothetical protein
VCSVGGPIHYAVFFCTDEGFGIEMVKALDEPHALDIVQAVQPGAVARAVPAASLEGKDRHRLLSDWIDALEQSMARSGWASDPNPTDPRGAQQSTITRAAEPQISC